MAVVLLSRLSQGLQAPGCHEHPTQYCLASRQQPHSDTACSRKNTNMLVSSTAATRPPPMWIRVALQELEDIKRQAAEPAPNLLAVSLTMGFAFGLWPSALLLVGRQYQPCCERTRLCVSTPPLPPPPAPQPVPKAERQSRPGAYVLVSTLAGSACRCVYLNVSLCQAASSTSCGQKPARVCMALMLASREAPADSSSSSQRHNTTLGSWYKGGSVAAAY
jgi:hypothetical protein